MSRVIAGLVSARACSRPSCIPKSRPRGKKAAGLRYERDLAKAVGGVHGQWFEFQDSRGHGWCQPDLFFERDGVVFVLEAKYTWTEAGYRQLECLYKPVLGFALRKRVFGMVVCKVLLPKMEIAHLCRDLDSACEAAASGGRVALHWIGAGLEPLRRGCAPGHLATPALHL